MGREMYQSKKFNAQSQRLIGVINTIVEDYQEQGYVLTVRQLYYQLVSKAVIENTVRSYKAIASLVNDARLAGEIDWDAIEDRTRAFIRRSHWSSGASIVQACVDSYHQDMWVGQPCRVLCIVEKEALAGVLERVCNELDVPLLAARGYPSGTVLREFTERDLLPARENEQEIVILHLGDHDPSGIDMTRDLIERIDLFSYGADIKLERIALNMPQIEELQPPENPAKTTDARFEGYRRRFGESSWELDALTPDYLTKLVRRKVTTFIDLSAWDATQAEIKDVKAKLSDMAEQF